MARISEYERLRFTVLWSGIIYTVVCFGSLVTFAVWWLTNG